MRNGIYLCILFTVTFFNFYKTSALPSEKKLYQKESIVSDSSTAQVSARQLVYITNRVGVIPVIDGKLDDECWLGENWQLFTFQREPVNCGKPTEKTEFKILYDDKYLYAAMRMFDSEPGKISRLLSGRDNFAGDAISICLDSYHDKRTSFEFSVTAGGGKIDLNVTNGNEVNSNWNAVYDARSAMEDSAWTAEFKIPFSQLRFSDKEEQVWGLQIWRWIYRKVEEDDWAYNPITAATWVDLYSELRGLKGIKAPARVEILPYFLGKYNSFPAEDGNSFRTGTSRSFDLGLDGKVGLSGSFTMDFTVNPDFGQIEADPSRISLSAYELSYDEKRPFFIEGNSILNFNCLFYPRRIGHLPSYRPGLQANEYINMPEKTSILGALKITGKNDDGLSIGILESLTARESAEIQTPNGNYTTEVEPPTNYLVGRLQKEFYNGDFVIGGAFTAVNRTITQNYLKFLCNGAYTGGADFIYKWSEKNYYLKGNAIFSHVSGDKESITRIQLSPAHNFQRPFADYLHLDSSATTLTGSGGSIEFAKSGGSPWRFSENFSWYSPNLEVNDIGYLPASDRIFQQSGLGYVINTPSGLLRNYLFNLQQKSTWNFGSEKLEFNTGLSVAATFVNNWGASASFSRDFNALSPYLIWGGPAFKIDGGWNFEYSLNSDYTKAISGVLSAGNKRYDDHISKNFHIVPSLQYRITDALFISGEAYYDFTRDNLQYIETQSNNGSASYFLGQVDQKVYRFTMRLSYFITPDLAIQFYGSPFLATRRYSAVKIVTNPTADQYKDRFYEFTHEEITFDDQSNKYKIKYGVDGKSSYQINNPNVNFHEFRSNFVVRWEYSPGSTIQFVWSQGRSLAADYNSMTINRGLNRLFRIQPDDIFMIKINHWFSL